VAFNGVACSSDDLLGEVNQGGKALKYVIEASAVAKCAEMAGGARKVMKMTVEYAKQRVQFGQPISKFQAIQHHAANMLTYLDTSRMMAFKTCWILGQEGNHTRQAAMCKVWVGDAYRKLVNLGHHILGGYGFMEEVDIQFYFRRAKASELMFGAPAYYREILAEEMGL
jgi:alkylation response protein AidB-like acyl-CoA dehydrogenase